MLRTQAIVLISAVLLLGVILNLVRRRRFREEFSWLWLAVALFYLVMALKPDIINTISSFLGISHAITTLTFFGLLFIILILIHYSVKLSALATQMKDAAQQIAILDGELNKMNEFLENGYNQAPNGEGQQIIEQKNELRKHM